MMKLEGRKIILAGDHAGFGHKEAIAKWLYSQGAEVNDFGPHSNARTDFPRHIAPAARALAANFQEGDHACRAIFIDGAGYPSGILANKFRGVYAAVANDTLSAQLCRAHSNANALCLGGQVVGQTLALEIVKTFLATDYDEAKYGARVAMVTAAETENFDASSGDNSHSAASEGALEMITLRDVQRALENRTPLIPAPSAKLTPSAQEIFKL